ncbi:MAG TPA: helix-turn-helix domain-containing protein [Thermoplasmata archaeon]|nr:helix-turn-helix domain-containing protein [Thermoplasmata archaeon]
MVGDPLGLESRRRMYELVAGTPGLHLRDIARRLGVDVRTADYHVRQLAKHGLVSAIEEAGFVRLYPRTANGRRAEIVDARDKPLLSILRRPVPLSVALVLLTRERVTHGELASEAGVAPPTLSYHLSRMERLGMVSRDASKIALREPERIARLLYAYRPTPDLIDRFLDLWEDFTL